MSTTTTYFTKTIEGKRFYYVSFDGEFFQANFRPINKATGKTWQAARGVSDGHDGHILVRYAKLPPYGCEERQRGEGPVPSDWLKSGKWSGASQGFTTEAKAIAAIEKHAAKIK